MKSIYNFNPCIFRKTRKNSQIYSSKNLPFALQWKLNYRKFLITQTPNFKLVIPRVALFVLSTRYIFKINRITREIYIWSKKRLIRVATSSKSPVGKVYSRKIIPEARLWRLNKYGNGQGEEVASDSICSAGWSFRTIGSHRQRLAKGDLGTRKGAQGRGRLLRHGP